MNDKVFLVAPSSKIKKKHLFNAINKVSLLDLEPIFKKNIVSGGIYFAGSVKRRVNELNEAFNSEANYIFAMKGGYAIMELFNFLDWNSILTKNKVIMGFSDISALLIALNSKNYSGLLIHGPNMGLTEWNLEEDLEYINLIKRVISNEEYKFDLNNLDIKYRNLRNFSGKIVGGNLRIISLLYGTGYELNIEENSILFLEDVRERPAAIYTMLLQLEMTGKLKNIKALLLGKMVKCGKYLPLLELFLDRFDIPIIYELPIGHEGKNMFPIRLNSNIVYDEESNIISFEPVYN